MKISEQDELQIKNYLYDLFLDYKLHEFKAEVNMQGVNLNSIGLSEAQTDEHILNTIEKKYGAGLKELANNTFDLVVDNLN